MFRFSRFFISLICLVVLIPIIFPSTFVSGQTTDIEAERARLQADLSRVDAQIVEQTKLLQSKQKESASIERDIAILDYQISTAKLKIKAKQIEIKRLGGDIGKKQTMITTLTEKSDRQKESLAEIIRDTRDLDDISLPEVVLTEAGVAEIFQDITSYQSINEALNHSFTIIQNTKMSTEAEKKSLETRQAAEIDAKNAIEVQNKLIEASEKQKKSLLAISKSQESNYRRVIAAHEAEKAKIKSALFRLAGGSTAISFGQAYNFAQAAQAKTGVRAAFLLAIITQESNLGKNVGTCNRPGDPASKSWKNIMKPSRDYEPYVRITKSLGLDPDVQPLSCPLSSGGYGGAMGPAQFIPSTWELYIDRVAAVTGNNPPSPWNPQDAFAASSIFLADLGAGGGVASAERKAALRYYAGSNWSLAKNAFYGDSVMKIAAEYQAQIDVLQSN